MAVSRRRRRLKARRLVISQLKDPRRKRLGFVGLYRLPMVEWAKVMEAAFPEPPVRVTALVGEAVEERWSLDQLARTASKICGWDEIPARPPFDTVRIRACRTRAENT